MADACTGVILVNPMLVVASRIQCDREGVSAFHALDEDAVGLAAPLSGAIFWW